MTMSLSLLFASLFLSNPIMLLASYVSIGNSFPKPLTPEEEGYYLSLYEAGDADAKNVLIEHNLRLVAHIAKKYIGNGRDQDDLISIGTIGLIKSVNTYNSHKAVRLGTYAAKCIDNEILMSIRSSKKIKFEVSLSDPIGMDKDGNEISFSDILGSDPDIIINTIDNKMQVKQLYDSISKLLNDREKYVILKRYGLAGEIAKPQREVAKELGISRSYVSRIEKKALSKLKAALGDFMTF